jgi:signal transduction histidine kinase
MWMRLGLLCAVVLGVVATVGIVFARGVSQPVRHLEHAAKRLADGDLSVRVSAVEGPPEIRSLSSTFNTTAAQLERLVDSQERFVADASHQLRTPLTALRLRLETLEPHIGHDVRPKFEAAIAETARLGRLVQSLLVLARSDSAEARLEDVDLAAVVADRVDAWGAVAADGHVTIADASIPDVWVRAVTGGLEQILDNLLGNALDVVPDDSTITVRVVSTGNAVELHVVDEGPGMPPDARAHAFERFWQPDDRMAANDGFGLGLAIVRDLAARGGGDARLDPGPGGVGVDAVVTLRRSSRGGPDDRTFAERSPSAQQSLTAPFVP